MSVLTYREAIRVGLEEALAANPETVVMGEDVGAYGGSYAVTKGFMEKYGEERIIDTPISESGFVGAGIGAAIAGMRPIVEIMTINFSLLAMDQIINIGAKARYMSGGQITVPIVIRTVSGGGTMLAATHSQSLESWYARVPGLKVVTPSNAADALGLLRSAIADPNPVMYIEHSLLYGSRGDVPDEHYTVPIGFSAGGANGSGCEHHRVLANGSHRAAGGGNAGDGWHRRGGYRPALPLAAGFTDIH